VAALAETPDEQSDVAAPQGSEIEPASQAAPDQVEDGFAAEIGSGAERDEQAAAAVEDEVPSAAERPGSAPEPAEPRELAVAGRRLGGRYRLERLVRGFGGPFLPEPQLWVGVDELLNRRVGVDLIATEHPLAEQVARAARDAAAVADARFVQVLDAVQDEDLLYIVTEWVPGAEQLQERLADGPLSPPRATRMVRELAEAMVRAHEAEVAHGAMNPATVMITAAGETKLRGLLVEATLSGQEPEAAEPEERYAADVLALGQIWYAALTARWPGTEAEYGLEPAPDRRHRALHPRADPRRRAQAGGRDRLPRPRPRRRGGLRHGQGTGRRDQVAAADARGGRGAAHRAPAQPQRPARRSRERDPGSGVGA
jgi:hypothetical protein